MQGRVSWIIVTAVLVAMLLIGALGAEARSGQEPCQRAIKCLQPVITYVIPTPSN